MGAYSLGGFVGTLVCPTFAIGSAVIFAQWIAKKSGASKRTTLWIGISTGLVVAVICGAGTLFRLAAPDSIKDVHATPSISASSSQPSPSASASTPTVAARKVTLTLPAKLGGRPPSKDRDFNKLAESLEPLLPGGSEISGVFGDINRSNQVLVLATKMPSGADPQEELASVFSWLALAEMPVKGAVTVPAGPLGGQAKCGTIKVEGLGTALCAWADEGSVGVLWWFPGTLGRAKGEFLKLRAQVEHRA